MTITIKKVRKATSLQEDNLRMNVEINHPNYGWIPYTLDPADTDTTINNDEVMALIGTDFAAYVAPTQVELDAALALDIRSGRDARLTEVDAIAGNALRWAELTSSVQAEWSNYRQELLDVPQQDSFPNNITWPIKPE
jgi:inorganic pyrophosphatase